MAENQVIQDRIRRKQAEVSALEEKLKAAKVYLTALQDILKDLNKAAGAESGPDREAKLKPGSSVAQAREIILKQGEPVHVDDILDEMGKARSASNRASLVGSIAAYVRKEEIFTRTAPNTFGLLELGHTDEAPEEDDEPPAGFGRAPVHAFEIDDDAPF